MLNETINELKALIEQSKKAHEISLDESLDEDTTDAAYSEYWTYLRKIAAVLTGLIGVDEKTALRMAAHKADQILDLAKRAA